MSFPLNTDAEASMEINTFGKENMMRFQEELVRLAAEKKFDQMIVMEQKQGMLMSRYMVPSVFDKMYSANVFARKFLPILNQMYDDFHRNKIFYNFRSPLLS